MRSVRHGQRLVQRNVGEDAAETPAKLCSDGASDLERGVLLSGTATRRRGRKPRHQLIFSSFGKGSQVSVSAYWGLDLQLAQAVPRRRRCRPGIEGARPCAS